LPNDTRIGDAYEQYRSQVGVESLDHLFALYGARAIEVLALIEDAPDLAKRLIDSHPNIRAEVVHAIRSEMAHTVLDYTRRRTVLAMNANYGYDVLAPILETLQQHCGWDEEKCQQQQQYKTFMEENCIPDYVLETSETRSLQTA
jgi:glycerol-3-phosphate dehydrogenase